MVDPRVGTIHAQHSDPSTAVLCVGLVTAACMLARDAIRYPSQRSVSVACAIGWSATCAACPVLARHGDGFPHHHLSAPENAVAAFGASDCNAMALMKNRPGNPGHFTAAE